MNLFKRAWNHKFFVSIAFSDTSAARGVYVRAFWPLAFVVTLLLLSGGMFFVGETARAQLAARMAGDVESAQYLSRILEMEKMHELQDRQMDVLARELGTLQSRLERFDVIGERLVSDADMADLISAADLEHEHDGQGGPDTTMPETAPSLEELILQLGIVRQKADRAQLALETGVALSLKKNEAQAGMPTHFPVVHRQMRISSGYGWRVHPITKRRHLHDGFDVAAPRGAPVVSAADGIVVYAGYRYGYGLTVEVRHANGFSTRYAHLSKVTTENGQQVNAGALIGLVGTTGRSTGNHLHFEILQGDEKLNPRPFIIGHYSAARSLAAAGYGDELISDWKTAQARKVEDKLAAAQLGGLGS